MKDGTENLIPTTQRTKDEARELSKKGGIASGEARRKKRDMRKSAELFLEMFIKDGLPDDLEEIQNLSDVKGKNITVNDAIIAKVMFNAMNGDIQSVRLIQELTGQKPKEEVEVTTKREGKIGGVLKQLEAKKK